MSKQSDNNFVWLDLEMTGLDLDSERIIEIATIVTDNQLNVLAEGPVMAIHQSDELLDAMGGWCTKQHNKSGLVDRVRASNISVAEAERQTLEFLHEYVSQGKSPMCGNSICTDRQFLNRYMPTLEKFFHYRNLDVSTLKILAQQWQPELAKQFNKESTHLAMDDIKESINEMKFYREHFIRSSY